MTNYEALVLLLQALMLGSCITAAQGVFGHGDAVLRRLLGLRRRLGGRRHAGSRRHGRAVLHLAQHGAALGLRGPRGRKAEGHGRWIDDNEAFWAFSRLLKGSKMLRDMKSLRETGAVEAS